MGAVANPRPAATPTARISIPESYEGGREGLKTFLTNMELYCRFNASSFLNDQDKILAASMHMKGKAAEWLQPLISDYLDNVDDVSECKEETTKVFRNWDSFKKEITSMFGEVDEQQQAEKAILAIKQKGSASRYTADFKQLQAKIDWDDAPLKTAYYNGLKENVKDEVSRSNRPDSLSDMVELAVRIDNRLYERSQEKKNQPRLIIANSGRGRTRTHIRRDRDGDVVMDIDKVQEKKQRNNRKFDKQKKSYDGTSAKERQDRFDNNACLACGVVGHFRRDCPKAAGRIKAVKIAMIRFQEPLPKGRKRKEPEPEPESESGPEAPSSENESEEETPIKDARIMSILEISQGNPRTAGSSREPNKIRLTDSEIFQRLNNDRCWLCGMGDHKGPKCSLVKSTFEISGPFRTLACRRARHEQGPQFGLPSDTRKPMKVHREIAMEPRQVSDIEVYMRVRNHQCWICGVKGHLGQECPLQSQVTEVIGIGHEIATEIAIKHQGPKGSKTHSTELDHWKLCWTECRLDQCHLHERIKKEVRLQPGIHSHGYILEEECPITGCHVHDYDTWATQHDVTGWIRCYEDDCMTHYPMKHDTGIFPTGPNKVVTLACMNNPCERNHTDPIHRGTHWYLCEGTERDTDKVCLYHLALREYVASTPTHKEHQHIDVFECLQPTCKKHCEQVEQALGLEPSKALWFEKAHKQWKGRYQRWQDQEFQKALVGLRVKHREGVIPEIKEEPQPEETTKCNDNEEQPELLSYADEWTTNDEDFEEARTQDKPEGLKVAKIGESSDHGAIHWTGCYEDQCLTHLSSKESGYYPRRPRKDKLAKN